MIPITFVQGIKIFYKNIVYYYMKLYTIKWKFKIISIEWAEKECLNVPVLCKSIFQMFYFRHFFKCSILVNF